MDKKQEAFGRILKIMDELREQCPWDKKQTWDSLRYLTIEELYELSDAILDKNDDEIKKELGDVMLHLIFYAKIAEEQGKFDIADVIHAECEKLITRHPHIYGDVTVQDDEEVKRNWENLKLKEGKTSVLQGVPKSLPALVKAHRMQEKAKGVGFEWSNAADVWKKVEEEMSEFHEQSVLGDTQKMEEEFGDLLFSLVNYARFIGINPEDALERTNKKFIYRFQYMEEKARENKRQLSEMTLEEMDVYWNEAKKR